MNDMPLSQSLILELDKLKSVYRKSYISNEDRRENSAEHSWHLAVAVIAMKKYLPHQIDINKMISMALLHDVCEIGAGDVCAYHADIIKQRDDEQDYIDSLRAMHPEFGDELLSAWSEYEDQETLESRWLKLFDKLVPFILNITSKCRTWNEQEITPAMIEKHNEFIKSISPTIHAWMMTELERAIKQGWIESPKDA